MKMSLTRYARFLVVGAFVGILTVGCRELIGRILVVDTRLTFTVSIVLAYAFGITLGFLLNHRFTFDADGTSRNAGMFLRFVVVAVIGLVLTWLLSFTFRYAANLDAQIGPAAKPAAFAIAALLASLITYPLNARFVFSAAGTVPTTTGRGS